MEHLALTLFSICTQAAIGIMVFVAIGRLVLKEGVYKNAIIAAAALGIIGMLASVLHLGRPFSAIKALNQFNTSWLSREIWFTALFVGITVLAVVLIYAKPQSKGAVTGLAVAAALVGLTDILFMAAIYSSSSVPLWQGAATFVEFYAAAISMGAVVFFVLSIKEAAKMKQIIVLTVSAAVILQVAVVVPGLIALGASSSTAAQNSLMILGGLSAATAIKWICILTAAVLIAGMTKQEISKSVTNVVLSSAALLLAGQIVGRYLFYAAMVVTGVGLS